MGAGEGRPLLDDVDRGECHARSVHRPLHGKRNLRHPLCRGRLRFSSSVGLGLRWRAARQFNGRPAPWGLPLLIPVALLAVVFVLWPYPALFYISTAMASAQMAATAWEYWRDRADGLSSRYALVICYALTGPRLRVPRARRSAVLGRLQRDLSHDLLAQIQITTLVINAAGAGAFSLSLAFERTATELRRAALTDQLTGLPNRRALEGFLVESLRRRPGSSNVLVLLDIDHFKRINDRFGHAVGDEILKQCAELMRSMLRSADFLARIGGEEFAMILDGLSRDEALGTVNRIRRAIERRELRSGSARVRMTISAGVFYAPNRAWGFRRGVPDRRRLPLQGPGGRAEPDRSGSLTCRPKAASGNPLTKLRGDIFRVDISISNPWPGSRPC